jgi:hypothetical protein
LASHLSSQRHKVGIRSIDDHTYSCTSSKITQHSIYVLGFTEAIELIDLEIGQHHPVRSEGIGNHARVCLVNLEDSDVRRDTTCDAGSAHYRGRQALWQVSAGGIGEYGDTMSAHQGRHHCGGRRLSIRP